MTALIATLTALWLALSIVNQFRRGAAIAPIKRRDIFALIPIWTFFAPRPGVTDYNVLYRDRSPSGAYSPWYEMKPPRPGRGKALWNPSKRTRKGITDMCNMLLKLGSRGLGRRLYVRLPYLALLHYVSTGPRTDVSHLRQFAIVRTSGHDALGRPRILFISALHRLERRS